MQHVLPGQPLSIAAADWNQLVDATRQSPSVAAQVRYAAQRFNTGMIRVRNDSTRTFQRYDEVGLDEPVWLPEDGDQETQQHLNGPTYSIAPMDYCRHVGRWGVLIQPLRPCEVGWAVMSGLTNAWIPPQKWTTQSRTILDVGQSHSLISLPNNAGVAASSQVLWAGPPEDRSCPPAGVVAKCRDDGRGWVVTENNCPEGCSPYSCAAEWYYVACDPGDEQDLACCASDLALLRIGHYPVHSAYPCLPCSDTFCRYQCRDDGGGHQWHTVRDECDQGCVCPDLNDVAIAFPTLFPCAAASCPEFVTYHCVTTTTTSTTSTTSTTTSTLPPSTTTTTTTTTLPPTTTTASPCSSQDCNFQYIPFGSGYAWYNPGSANTDPAYGFCATYSSCGCNYPPWPTLDDTPQVAVGTFVACGCVDLAAAGGPCNTLVTTTTTAAPTTTTTAAPTTTTTAGPCTGDCSFHCVNVPSYNWAALSVNCSAGCNCPWADIATICGVCDGGTIGNFCNPACI